MEDTMTGGPSSEDLAIAVDFRIVLHRLVKIMRRQTKNEAGLSQTERSVLGQLYPDVQLAPTDIARVENVTTQSISQVVNHLDELKFIERTPSGEDKRKTLLSLTPEGRFYIEQLRRDKQEWFANRLHEKTTAEEKELLMKAMQVLNKLI